MDILIKRIARRDTYTIGQMYLDGEYFCDTLEDKDRGLKADMPAREVAAKKVKGQTAIPTGRYALRLDVVSPRFGGQAFYKETCGGMLPRLEGVTGFSGVLIHCGNTERDTEGCILVGRNRVKGKVMESRETFRGLYGEYLAKAKRRGEDVFVEII